MLEIIFCLSAMSRAHGLFLTNLGLFVLNTFTRSGLALRWAKEGKQPNQRTT